MPAWKLSRATPCDSLTFWTTEGLRGTEFGFYYWLLLSKTLHIEWIMRVFEMPAFAAHDQLSTMPDTRPSFTWRRTEGLTGAKGSFIKLPIVFQRRVIHGISMTLTSVSLFIFVLWSNKQNLGRFEWEESVVVLPAPDDWPHWKLSRLIITPMAEPGSQPYVYSAVLWLQTHHSGWTRRRALATFYPGWDLGGNNNLGNRLSEVTDQHNTPKRTFVRLRLWCLFKKNNHHCPLSIRQ